MTADDFVEEALERFRVAAGDRGSPLRNLALATVGPDGAADARTVVLRECTADPLAVTFWTDARAGKIAALTRDRRLTLLAWSEPEQLQLRLIGTATVHRGDRRARAAWDAMSAGARRAYGLDRPPGDPIGAPDEPRLPDEAIRFAAFALIAVAVDRVDVLHLGPHGAQTRARRDAGGTGWVAP